MNYRTATACLALCLIPLYSAAQPKGKPNCDALKNPAEQLACMERYADCTTPEWLSGAARAECAAEERAMQRGLEDHRKRRLEAMLSASEKAKLRAADAAYERYAKAQCELEAEHALGGSMYASEVNICMQYLKGKRLEEYTRMQENFRVLRSR